MKLGRTMIVVGVTALSAVTAWAQPRHVYVRPPAHARHIIVAGTPYWVDAGVYYRWGDGGYVTVSAPVVRVLPPRTRVVVVHGGVYYMADDIYYRSVPEGYVVVEPPISPPPVVTPVRPEVPTSTQTLYVPKKAGDGYVPVTLKKTATGYIGPQGEFYPTMPPVALLTEMYGLDEQAKLVPPNVFFIYVPNKDGQTFTRVMLTRRDQGFVGPQGEFYPLMPTVAHLAELYGTAQGSPAAKPQDAPKAPEAPKVQEAPKAPEAPKADDSIIHIQIPKKNGEGFADVQLKKTDQGYIGPRGELYEQLPTFDQLTPVYGD